MEIINDAVQVVNANSNVVFDTIRVPGNCSIIYTQGSGQVKLRGLTSTQCRARFRVYFGGNIAVPTGGTAGPISLALTVDGEPVTSTTMTVTPAAVNEYFNVSSSIYLDIPACCCSTIGIRNINTVAINVQNANLIVERVA